ncbi:MAG: glycoside hydrolase family 3 N-terminal domain-containing protein [Oscillospiraceae bacterium]
MFGKNEMKKAIVTQVCENRKLQKARKAEIAAMPQQEREKARKQDIAQQKAAKVQRKADISAMPKAEKRLAKKQDKMYKKIKNRPIRFTALIALACVFAFAFMQIAPIVSSVSRLFTISLDSETPQGQVARDAAAIVAREVSDEGIVLLKNQDNSLPLKSNKVNVFSKASFNIKYSGSGSGAASTDDAVDFYTALEQGGIEYNKDLVDTYRSIGATGEKEQGTGLAQIASIMLGKKDEGEPAPDYLTNDVLQNAKAYSENAIVFLSNSAAETSDLTPQALSPSATSLALLEKVCGNFENVTVIINAGNAIQLGFLEQYPSIKSALWIGTPGPYGCQSLADILAGKINPSGRLVDTYAYDATTAPATVNLGDYKFDNIEKMSFLNYEEGIYIGYRFYETYYANDEAGYKKAVQFPFGYGLSYTQFDWETVKYDVNNNKISAQVKVTNTGEVAGKEVVQLYFTPPYTANGIEKSAIELGGYAKTKLLQPNESQVVTVSFDTRDMSSYDEKDAQAYVLEAGKYDIKVGKSVHNIVSTEPYTVEKAVIYNTDDATDAPIENRFDYANGDLTYLSRSDWDATYPRAENRKFTASDEVVSLFAQKPAKGEGVLPTMGAENGIILSQMKGLDFDDPQWDKFLDQFTFKEMQEIFVNGAYKTAAVDRLGIPETILLDGPAGINSFFTKVVAAAYPTLVVIASTWNDDLAQKLGDAVGNEAEIYGVTGWYAPGMNLHRTAMGGRNFEYYSEDPLLSGKMAAAMVRGAQKHNILVFMKHFALNEQEINARSGVSVWSNEQALREMHLRAFEITVKEADVTAAMSSFIYIGHKWSGGNPELLQDVLRTEWGFDGIVSTDAVLGSFMDANMALRYGNELMLDPLVVTNRKYVAELYKADPVGVANGLRDRMHTFCHTLVNRTNLFS